MNADVLNFADLLSASRELAKAVLNEIERAIADRGYATVVLPGGRTPTHLLRDFQTKALDWGRVTFAPTDELQVPREGKNSTLGLLQARLDSIAGKGAVFQSLGDGHAATRLPLPIDVAVLGMGADGHIASLYPGCRAGSARSAPIIEVLERDLPAGVQGDRWSWSLSALCEARRIFMLAGGADKLPTLHEAIADEASVLPAGRLIHGSKSPVSIYWADTVDF